MCLDSARNCHQFAGPVGLFAQYFCFSLKIPYRSRRLAFMDGHSYSSGFITADSGYKLLCRLRCRLWCGGCHLELSRIESRNWVPHDLIPCVKIPHLDESEEVSGPLRIPVGLHQNIEIVVAVSALYRALASSSDEGRVSLSFAAASCCVENVDGFEIRRRRRRRCPVNYWAVVDESRGRLLISSRIL